MDNIIKEQNKLIAEYMGYEVVNEEDFLSYKIIPSNKTVIDNDLNYHKNWNSLMDVIEKIEEIDEIDVNILTNGTVIYEWRNGNEIANNCANISFDKKIEHAYDSVIKFILWWNKKKI